MRNGLLQEHCREYNSTFLSMPIQSLCNGACYDALRSDTCRLPNQMKMLLSDGTMENWTEYADARYYGPNMTVCKSIYEGSVTDMVEFIPNPARLPATPPRPNCTALSPWDLCVVFVGPLPALAPNLTTVSFSASLTFREAPQGFENRWQYLYRRGLLQADTGVNVSRRFRGTSPLRSFPSCCFALLIGHKRHFALPTAHTRDVMR